MQRALMQMSTSNVPIAPLTSNGQTTHVPIANFLHALIRQAQVALQQLAALIPPQVQEALAENFGEDFAGEDLGEALLEETRVNGGFEEVVVSKCTQALGTKDLKKVKSLRLETEIENAGETWKEVRKKFLDRERLIDELLKMQGLPQAEVDTLKLLKTGTSGDLSGLCDYMRANVNSPNFDYNTYIYNDFLTYHRNYQVALEDENEALGKLVGSRYKYFKASSQGAEEFQDNYLKFVKQIIRIKEEMHQKHRMDTFFDGEQVQKHYSQ